MSTQYNITLDLWSLFHLAKEEKLKTAVLFQIDFCNRKNEKGIIQKNWRNYLSTGKVNENYWNNKLKEIENIVSKKQQIWKFFDKELLFKIEIKKRREVEDLKKIFYSYFLSHDYDILEKFLKVEFNNFSNSDYREFIIEFNDKPDIVINVLNSSNQKRKRLLGIEITKVSSLTDKEIGGSVARNVYDKIEKKEWSKIKDKGNLIKFNSNKGFEKYCGGSLNYSVDLKRTDINDLVKNLLNQLKEKNEKVKSYDCEKIIIWTILLPDFWADVDLWLERSKKDEVWNKELEEEIVKCFFLSKLLECIKVINEVNFFGIIVNYSTKYHGPFIDKNGKVYKASYWIEKNHFYIPIDEITEIIKLKKWEDNKQWKKTIKSFEEKYRRSPIIYFDKIGYPTVALIWHENPNEIKSK
ncbi:MAG: hypothetical protein I3273_05245 [Candidatus Moeniiplasma glomeromycotorum]|nr:hypothetical protein [Candidatus Moeniiplasma glomeromycotorum]MCE8168184.1 hypothetical protein [Candidatus Moeniiplasma glomeromycotorum]MCE8169496.1 hypothetical protein [Candidatus Moeniiplasma glomeromycotorum]